MASGSQCRRKGLLLYYSGSNRKKLALEFHARLLAKNTAVYSIGEFFIQVTNSSVWWTDWLGWKHTFLFKMPGHLAGRDDIDFLPIPLSGAVKLSSFITGCVRNVLSIVITRAALPHILLVFLREWQIVGMIMVGVETRREECLNVIMKKSFWLSHQCSHIFYQDHFFSTWCIFYFQVIYLYIFLYFGVCYFSLMVDFLCAHLILYIFFPTMRDYLFMFQLEGVGCAFVSHITFFLLRLRSSLSTQKLITTCLVFLKAELT